MKVRLGDILQENIERSQRLFPKYNPELGEGTVHEQVKVIIDKKVKTYIVFPKYAAKQEIIVQQIIKAGSIKAFCQKSKVDYDKIMQAITILKVKHDFEYWAATCVKIWDKLNEGEVPFVLRPAQRKLLRELEDMRLKKMPIRIILLKARQWGGSTLVQLYMAWIQLFHKTNWHSAIVAHVKDAAKHIRGMYQRMSDSHPDKVQEINLKPYEQSQSIKYVPQRGCLMGVASSETPDALRTYNFHMTHLSEVSFFKDTEKRTAEDLIQTIRASVPSQPYTVAVLESTAKGVGNFFHKEWLKAIDKNSGSAYRPVFVAWWEIEIYVKPIEEYHQFLKNMDDYDWQLWHLGATLEGINWYKTFKRAEGYSDWRMMSEFPSTANEAFQSTGRTAFLREHILHARRNCVEPIFIGDIYGKAFKGEEALDDIKLQKSPDGNLQIWEYPDTAIRTLRRYALFADIGGKHRGSDFSAIKVLDRLPILEGGKPKVVAVWHGHLDQDLFAWKCAQLATYYLKGLLALEANSLKKHQSEGNHFLTVLDEIAQYYDNLYARTSPDRVREHAPEIYGFHTNRATKPMLIAELNASLRDDTYIERHAKSCDEMEMYEVKNDGSYGAVSGMHDDLLIVTAGVLWLSNKHMELPAILSDVKKTRNQIVNESSL